MDKILFLDRDGVINERPDAHIINWTDFHFLPDVKEELKKIREMGYTVIIISNQSCIGRGTATEDTVDLIMVRMAIEIEEAGGKIEDIYYCPHAPDDGCDCRKPEPGLILKAAKENSIDLNDAWFIGDDITDVDAAKSAGVKSIFINNGTVDDATLESISQKSETTVGNLAEAVEFLSAQEN